MILPAPPVWNQFALGMRNGCGECAVASCLSASGTPTTPADIMRFLGLTGDSETSTWQLHQALGLMGNRHPSTVADLPVAFPDEYLILLLTSDSGGNIVPRGPIGHWVACYGINGESYYIANSGAGLLEIHSRTAVEACYAGVTIHTGCFPIQPPPPQETDMTIDTARLIVWGWYPAILKRRPESQDAVDAWASRLAAGQNPEQVITEFCDTPEARSILG